VEQKIIKNTGVEEDSRFSEMETKTETMLTHYLLQYVLSIG
jgi:hypothetical protein